MNREDSLDRSSMKKLAKNSSTQTPGSDINGAEQLFPEEIHLKKLKAPKRRLTDTTRPFSNTQDKPIQEKNSLCEATVFTSRGEIIVPDECSESPNISAMWKNLPSTTNGFKSHQIKNMFKSGITSVSGPRPVFCLPDTPVPVPRNSTSEDKIAFLNPSDAITHKKNHDSIKKDPLNLDDSFEKTMRESNDPFMVPQDNEIFVRLPNEGLKIGPHKQKMKMANSELRESSLKRTLTPEFTSQQMLKGKSDSAGSPERKLFLTRNQPLEACKPSLKCRRLPGGGRRVFHRPLNDPNPPPHQAPAFHGQEAFHPLPGQPRALGPASKPQKTDQRLPQQRLQRLRFTRPASELRAERVAFRLPAPTDLSLLQRKQEILSKRMDPRRTSKRRLKRRSLAERRLSGFQRGWGDFSQS